MEPQRITCKLVENRVVGPHTFVLIFDGCEALAECLPGQFAMMSSPDWGTDPLLPRAFSILATGPNGRADVLVKTSGKASGLLENALPGATFHLLGPLGKAFPEPTAERIDWLVAGGVGLAPLLLHAQRAHRLGLAEQVTMFYGGRSAADLVLLDDIAATGCGIVFATEDGSKGFKGYVTGAVEQQLAEHTSATKPTLLACGPEPMLEATAALAHRHGLGGYLSLEGEMACGIGACLVCAVPCHSKPYRYTCVEGPVFSLEDLAGPYAAPIGDDR